MAQATEIEWTDATWNPVTGCTKIGPGCDNCYASRFAERWRGIEGHPYEQGFDLRLWPNRVDQPIRWRKPRLIFVNSMSDLFHKRVPIAFIDTVFDIGFGAQVDNTIDILGGTFESRCGSITSDILTRARAGRSIFLLDQCGYKDVPLSVCRYILETLPRSEIILTFAIDWLIDYLSANVSSLKAVAPVEISEDQVSRYLETKGLRGHRYLVQLVTPPPWHTAMPSGGGVHSINFPRLNNSRVANPTSARAE